ncbi:MAG TPA: YetF domain-containing protein [Actinomycetota bacterium]|nr:YetF domain-containing protein [Actinomycetota bacterium]
MSSIIRAVAVYGVLLLLFRISGKRSLAQITTFDAVLLLIIAEAIQQAMIDNDHSMTNALVVVITLLGLDVLMSFITVRSSRVDKLLNDAPLVLIENGKQLEDRMRRARVTPDDVLEQARALRGVERFDQIRYAVLERNGGITVIPFAGTADRPST